MTTPTPTPAPAPHEPTEHAAGAVEPAPPRGGVPPGAAPPPVHNDRRRRQVGWRSTDVLRTAALVIAMYVVLRMIWFASPLFLTAFLGVLFGLAVSAGVDRLQALTRPVARIPRGVAAAGVVIATLGVLAAFGAWMAPTLRRQGIEVQQRLPESIDHLETWVNARRGGLFGLLLGAGTEARVDSAAATSHERSAAPAAPAPVAGVAPVQPADSSRAAPAVPQAEQPVTLRQRIGAQVSKATKYFFPFLTSTLSALAGIVLVIFLSIYIAADPRLYHDGLMHLFPHTVRPRAGAVLSAMATVLRKWLVTQLIAMTVIGVVSTIVLLLLQVKAAFALGILAGLLEFIPTIGPVLSAVPAVAMGFVDSPEKALYIAVAYIGIQFAENHLLIPLLMKGGIDLPPVVTILSQALMALLFGFLGLLVAVPLVAAAIVPLKMLYVEGVVGDEVSIAGRVDGSGEDGDDDTG